MARLFRWTLLALLLSLVATGAVVGCEGGCSGCGSSEEAIPATAEARVSDLAAHLPKGTEVVVFAADLPELREALQTLKTRLGDLGLADTLQQQVENELGIDLLDPKSWEQAGIAPNAGLALAYWRDRVIVLTYVEDRQRFEGLLADRTKKAFGIEAVVKNRTEGGSEMKILSEDPARQIAWTYDGKLVMVSMPATSVDGALEKGSATVVLADVAGTKEPASLASKPEFEAFRKALIGEFPLAVYVNTQAYLERPEVQAELKADPRVAAGLTWTKANVDFVGAGLDAEGDQVVLKGYMGTKPAVTKAFEAVVGGPEDSALARFATENTLLGLRFNVDWDRAWALSLASMPEDQRRALQRDLKQLSDGLGLDVEAELLSKLTGDAGLYFYGIAGSPLQLMNLSSYAEAARKAGVIVAVELESAEAAANLVEKLRPLIEARAEIRPLMVEGAPVEGYTVIDLAKTMMPIGRIYIRGPVVAFATSAFGESSIREYFEAKRPEANLAEVEGLDLGADFAAGETFNGLYFNSARARENLGAALGMLGADQALESIQEAALKLGVGDFGPHATLVIDLAPSAAAPAGEPVDKPAIE